MCFLCEISAHKTKLAILQNICEDLEDLKYEFEFKLSLTKVSKSYYLEWMHSIEYPPDGAPGLFVSGDTELQIVSTT